MRYKKGTQVEVMEKGELPFGSWRPARIVEGNGHSYVVSYDNCYGDKSFTINKVPRKLIRPSPPTIWQRGFVRGEIVEVFENNSWQLAEFSQTLEGSIVVLRLFGSSKKIQAHRCQLRIPCTWKEDTWIAFPKEFVKPNNVHLNVQSKARNLSSQIPRSCLVTRTGDDIFSAKYDACADPQNQSSKRMKKRNNVYSTPLVSGSYKKKRRTMNGSGKCGKLTIQHLSTRVLQKVDAVDSPKNICGENFIHTALKKRRAELIPNEIIMEKQVVGSSHDMAEHLDIFDDKSAASSIGSCSVSNGSSRSVHYKVSQNRNFYENYDDSESFTTNPEDARLTRKGLPEKCNIDLDAYHSTMRSFYESGSLSWEQESMLTNLRLSLHISNDEHLMVLKHLMHTRR